MPALRERKLPFALAMPRAHLRLAASDMRDVARQCNKGIDGVVNTLTVMAWDRNVDQEGRSLHK